MKPLYLLIVALLLYSNLFAQSGILKVFTGFQQGSSIQLSFTIKGGNTCLGTDIQRSADSIQFTTIGSISGICGSNDKDETYTYQDEMPLVNQPNYYRLILGQLGNSEFISVPYLDYNEGILIFPNPVTASTLLYFPNEKNELFAIKIFDASGILQSVSSTRGASVSIGTKDLSQGIYLVTVEQEGTILFREKIAVQ
ncbi:MAG: T9SS type A sorting domain-containing protein [Chitinophagales bacterium]